MKTISGDLGREGLDVGSGIDIVIHCAASVSFEQSLDEALELNAKGPARLLQSVRDAGSDPYFIHVSTAYAAGMRTGLVLEKPSGTAPTEPWLDLNAELNAAKAWRNDIEAESRLPQHQHRFVAEAHRAIGPAGGPAVGTRAEILRYEWVREQLTERGRERARALGWSDTYGLSKALGERTLLGANPKQLTIVRPAIVESALNTPYPGWMESLKVADPIMLGYGAGIIPGRFGANSSIRIDIIPVDFVANACLVAAAHPPDEVRVFNVSTGMRNPFTIGDLADVNTKYFRERPLPDEDGLPVSVPDWRFSSASSILTKIERATNVLEKGRTLVDKLPIPRSNDVELRLHKNQRKLDRLQAPERDLPPLRRARLRLRRPQRPRAAGLAASRRPRALRVRRRRRSTGTTTWRKSTSRRCARSPCRPRPARRRRRAPGRRPAPEGPPALALFDVEGVVLDSHRRALLRLAADPRHARAGQARVDRRRRDQGARAGSSRTAARAPRSTATSTSSTRTSRRASSSARPRRRCRTSSSRASSTRPSAGSASTSAAATA